MKVLLSIPNSYTKKYTLTKETTDSKGVALLSKMRLSEFIVFLGTILLGCFIDGSILETWVFTSDLFKTNGSVLLSPYFLIILLIVVPIFKLIMQYVLLLLFGAKKVTFYRKAKLGDTYIQCDEYISRRAFLIYLVAPDVLIAILDIICILLLPNNFFWLLYIVLAGTVAGLSGNITCMRSIIKVNENAIIKIDKSDIEVYAAEV